MSMVICLHKDTYNIYRIYNQCLHGNGVHRELDEMLLIFILNLLDILYILYIHIFFRWFSPGTPVSSSNTTDRRDLTEIILKVAFN